MGGIGSTITAASRTASAATTQVLAAASDEVSTGIAALFATHGQQYQTLSAQAAAFHERFIAALAAGANSYALAEAANTSPLQILEQNLLAVINTPTQLIVGRNLIGDGADATAPGGAGGDGGLLWGNGGNG
ncbi:PE family protein, partial [Mycobacterium riyadhense]